MNQPQKTRDQQQPSDEQKKPSLEERFAQMEEVMNAMRKKLDKIPTLESDIDKLQKKNTELEEKIGKLEQENKLLEKDNKRLKTQVLQLLSELEKMGIHNATLEEEKAKQQQQLLSMEKELKVERSARQAAEAELVGGPDTRLTELQSRNAQILAEKKALEEKLEEFKEEKEQRKRSDALVLKQRQEIEEQKEQIKAKDLAIVAVAQEAKEKVQQEIDKLKQTEREQKSVIDGLNQEKQNLKSDVDREKKAKESAQEDAFQLKKENEKYLSTILDQKSTIDKERQQSGKKDEIIQEKEAKLNQLRREVDDIVREARAPLKKDQRFKPTLQHLTIFCNGITRKGFLQGRQAKDFEDNRTNIVSYINKIREVTQKVETQLTEPTDQNYRKVVPLFRQLTDLSNALVDQITRTIKAGWLSDPEKNTLQTLKDEIEEKKMSPT